MSPASRERAARRATPRRPNALRPGNFDARRVDCTLSTPRRRTCPPNMGVVMLKDDPLALRRREPAPPSTSAPVAHGRGAARAAHRARWRIDGVRPTTTQPAATPADARARIFKNDERDGGRPVLMPPRGTGRGCGPPARTRRRNAAAVAASRRGSELRALGRRRSRARCAFDTAQHADILRAARREEGCATADDVAASLATRAQKSRSFVEACAPRPSSTARAAARS